MTNARTSELLGAARQGDRGAFDELFGAEIPKLRGVLYRMVGHPDDVDDLAQTALLKAYEGLDGFRGDSSPGTWLCSIGARLAIDHLRGLKRWRERAQVIYATRVLETESIGNEVGAAFSDPSYSYDVSQHIAYCFTCVGRTLEPEQQAALVLRDVLDLSNAEAAKALNLSTSVLRHTLAEARDTMRSRFENLCALVNKKGACWQCAGLRGASPEGKRGPEAPDALTWDERVRTVRDAPTEGATRVLHEVFFRHTEQQEQQRIEPPTSTKTPCGAPSPGDDG